MNRIIVYIDLIFFLIVVSCSGNKPNDVSDAMYPKDDYSDLAGHVFYPEPTVETLLEDIIPETDVPQFRMIDSIEMVYQVKIAHFKDSLLSTVGKNNIIFLCDSLDRRTDVSQIGMIRKSLEGDMYAYTQYANGNNFCIKDSYKYALYMAEIHRFIPAYDDVYHWLYTENRIIKRRLKENRLDSLSGLSENKRNLALYSLIKGYKKGDISNHSSLSHYFRIGLHFPQDTVFANKLDSISLITIQGNVSN
ncbi:MAG: hypothetical protein LBL79_15085 [Prevotella sp.]|jgi:hypothetical protein|nr:hypothetical protein [Prevotella sp.]